MCDKMNTLCFILLSICLCQISSAADTLYFSQNITDGNSLVSPSGLFELGFFTPGSSKSRYLGIWYSNIPGNPVVWVANRAAPINDTSGHLIVNTTTMSLALLNKNKTVFWSSNSTKQTNPNSTSPVVQLLDNGNLILRDENEVANSGKYLWQSFDYPSDTLLPEMKLGWDVRTGLNRKLTAWKSPDDPSPTSLTWELVQHNYPEMSMFKDDKEFIRSGPWNGVLFSGKPPMALPALNFTFVMNENEVYTTVGTMNSSALERMVVNVTDQYKRQCLIWSEAERNWTLYAGFPRDPCSNYAMCGANGNCVLDASPLCQCLTRFQPRSAEKWNLNDFSLGCERKTPLSCKKDGYVAYPGLKLPDTRYTWIDKAMNLKECKEKCSSNCSCSAYANLDVRGGGSGCAIWFGDLVDLVQVPGGDQDLYIKISAAELGGKDEKWKIGVIVASVVAVILAIFGYCYILKLRHIRSHKATQNNFEEQDEEDLELPLFDFSTIETATNRFSINNKLGEGGFGPVYKGILMDGTEIAVKRLSKSSGQGTKEFKNEVILIAKLQHRNLVKLLGCCIQGIEKLLIYEYMPNKSLNSFIFDEAGRKLLDWKKRFNIICGISWGLLYLHEDSRLRIIHRDLKASNVLLDRNMNPKISDFGLARTIVGDQTEGNTNKVVGTYGYMAPEYAIEGQFSVKSDVFSFGILMLEIISGKKSKGFYHLNHNLNLIGNAWRLWNAGRPLELIDEFFGESYNLYEVLRSIHVSLLCVQKEPGNRPTMSAVVQMLSSETALPQPKEPGFPFLSNEASSNEMTISLLEAR